MEKKSDNEHLTNEEKLKHYIALANYYESQHEQLKDELDSLSEVRNQQEKKIEALEKGSEKQTLKNLPGPELKKTTSVGEDSITKINMNPKGTTTFTFTVDSKNPPVLIGEKIYIIGELTKGRREEMKLTSSNPVPIYSADLPVAPGFKYTFFFQIGDKFFIDAHYPKYRTKIGY